MSANELLDAATEGAAAAVVQEAPREATTSDGNGRGAGASAEASRDRHRPEQGAASPRRAGRSVLATMLIWLKRGAWYVGPLVLLVLALLIPMPDQSGGMFRVRPVTRLEVPVLEAGFLEQIEVQEGDTVTKGAPLARLFLPDMDVNLAKKQAEIHEAEANLRRLRVGTRVEELTEQELRVERAKAWRDRGKDDLERARAAFREEVIRLTRLVEQTEANWKFARQTLANAKQLRDQRALPVEQYQAEETKAEVARLQSEEAKAQRAARQALGTTVAESELARREKELGDVESTLRLLRAGSRVEDIEAEEARLARLQEELRYLNEVQARTVVHSPVTGIVTTPRMREKNGLYAAKGTVFCVIEELSDVFAEVSVPEDQEDQVQVGQGVRLRARALPDRTFQTIVDRKAPTAVVVDGKTLGTVTVYCRLQAEDAGVLSGMTGFARVEHGRTRLGRFVLKRIHRYLKTEFWL